MTYYPCSVFLLVSVLFSAGKWQAVAHVGQESTVATEASDPPPIPELEANEFEPGEAPALPPELEDESNFLGPEGAPAPSPESDTDFSSTSRQVAAKEVPFVVFLTTSSSKYLCGGVLVGKGAVLTTASCVLGQPLPQVVVGSIDNTQTKGPDVQVIAAREVVFHPSFLQSGNPNLAIVRLSSNADVEPTELLNSRFKIPEGSLLNMFGWGRWTSASRSAQTLQNTEIDYIAKGMCALALSRIIPKHEMCIDGEGSGSCDGSDGGPILWEGQLVGLIGRSHVCGQVGQLDVHIDIVPYTKWIKRISRTKTGERKINQSGTLSEKGIGGTKYVEMAV